MEICKSTKMGFRINPTREYLMVLIGLISKFSYYRKRHVFKAHLCQKETYLCAMLYSAKNISSLLAIRKARNLKKTTQQSRCKTSG